MKHDSIVVSIVIPNWNGKELLQKHLPAVVKAAKGAEIIVVDDASTDDSCEFITATYPSIQLIQKKTHEGFASTVNRGVEKASGEVVVLLNTDIEPEKDFLQALLPHFEHQSIFAVGCMDKSVERNNVVLRGRGIARWKNGFFIHSKGRTDTSDTAWVSGGSGAFRVSIWKKLGGMDTGLDPFYWEDIDLSYRAIKSGYTVRFEPQSIVIHKHEEGAIKSHFSKQQVKTLAFRNQLLFIWKNVTDPLLFLEHLVWLPIRLLQTTVKEKSISFLKGFFLAMLQLPAVLSKRAKVSALFRLKDREIIIQD